MSKTHRIVTITTDPAANVNQRHVVTLSGVTGAHLCGAPTQSEAERFADGLAYGLRLGGFTVRIEIDVTSDDAADDEPLDFAMFGETEAARPAKAATAPECDAVEARLERGHTANFYRAQHLERQGRGF